MRHEYAMTFSKTNNLAVTQKLCIESNLKIIFKNKEHCTPFYKENAPGW